MNITIAVCDLAWKTNNKGVWKALIKDLEPDSAVTFSEGYEGTVTGNLITVMAETCPDGFVTYSSVRENTAASSPIYGAGLVQDTVDVISGRRITILGNVDLSELAWTESSGTWSAMITGMKSGTSNVLLSNGFPFTVSGTMISVISETQPTGVCVYELATSVQTMETPQEMTLEEGQNIFAGGDFSIGYETDNYSLKLVNGSKYIVIENGTISYLTASNSNNNLPVVGGSTQVINLTHWFGKGYEPSSAAAFYARCPSMKGYAMAYNQGQAINYKGTGVRTMGFNFYNPATGTAVLLGGNEYQICGAYTSCSYMDRWGNEETLGIDEEGIFTPANDGVLTVTDGNATDTCVHLTWSGYKNYGKEEYQWEPYWEVTTPLNVFESFPEGMNGIRYAGSSTSVTVDARDELTVNGYVKRVEVVDGGDLSYNDYNDGSGNPSVYPYGYCFFSLARKKVGIINIKSDKYTTVEGFSTQDMAILGLPSNTGGYIIDSSFIGLTGAQIKERMTGVKIYYELAEPVTVTFPEPVLTDFPVSDFGTEELIPADDAPGIPSTTWLEGKIQYSQDFLRLLINYSKIYSVVKHLADSASHIAFDDGTYPNMISGAAYNLIDRNAQGTERQFSFDSSGGSQDITDGTAVAKKLMGTTLNPNQLVQDSVSKSPAGTGQIKVEDAVAGDIPSLTVEGRSLVKNQLVPPNMTNTKNSADGVVNVTDAVAGDAVGLTMTAPRSVVVNQWINVSDTSITLTNDRIWLVYIDGVSSKIDGTGQSISCTGGTDMAVDLTQYFNGDSTLIDAVESWEDLTAYDPRFSSYVSYNAGTVEGVKPIVKIYSGEYAYGVIMDTTVSTIPCQRVEYRNGVITQVDSFSSMPAHDWHRCVMDDLSTRHINYYLDPEDSNKKYNGTYKGVTSDGSASVLTGADGDFMVEMDITHWKAVKNYAGQGKHLYLVSDKPFKGSKIHRFFYTSPNGGVARTQYVGATRLCLCDSSGTPLNTTEGALSQNNGTSSTRKARSLAGALPWVNVNLTDLRTASKRNGGTIVNFDFHHYVHLMMTIEYADFNTQNISAGYSNGKTYAYWAWRKSGRTNYGNGTGQTMAVAGTQDDDNFYSLKVNNVQLYRDAANDSNGYYAWSNHAATATRYWTISVTPANGSVAYSDTEGTDSGYVTASWSTTADANKVIQFQYRGIENPFGEIWEFEDGFQKYQNSEGAKIRNNSNTSQIYDRDKAQDAAGAYAWTNAATSTTIWTASASPANNSASYTDSALTTSTGFTVNITAYRLFDGEYWHTNATDDYTSTAQHGNANPTYYREEHDWPVSGYGKTFDPLTFLVNTTGNGGSASAWFFDYFYNDNGAGSRVSLVGGNAYSGANDGMGIRAVNNALTGSNVHIGGRASA